MSAIAIHVHGVLGFKLDTDEFGVRNQDCPVIIFATLELDEESSSASPTPDLQPGSKFFSLESLLAVAIAEKG